MDADEPRLDLPLARRVATEVPSAQLSAESSPEPESDSSTAAPPAVQRVAQGGLPTPSSSESVQTLSSTMAPTASTPRVSVSRLPLVTDSPARLSRFSAPSASDAAAIAPLAGARLLRPTTTLQRDASIDTGPTLSPDAPTMSLPQRGRENPQLSDGERTEAPGMSFVQRETEDAPTLSLTQIARENGRLPLAPSRGISVQRASQPIDDSEAESAGADEAYGPTVQGVWYEAPVAISRVSVGAPAAESSSAAAGPHQASETEMDELARKLYDRLRNQLKKELLVDRERAGFLTDLR
jgi:hypothetical protein